MNRFDLVIRGGTVATAADTFRADVGIRDGRIVALAHDLGEGRKRSTPPASSCCRGGSTVTAT